MRQTRQSQRERAGQGPRGRALARISGLVRRMRVTASAGALWLLEGRVDWEGNIEPDKAENFENIGFASRPKATHNVEAVTVKVGGESGHPVIVATRDRDGLKILEAAEGLEEDETAVFTSSSMIKIKADGSVEIGSIGGTRLKLATKTDIEGLKTILDAWVPVPNDGGAALSTALAGWAPAYTTKLEAE